MLRGVCIAVLTTCACLVAPGVAAAACGAPRPGPGPAKLPPPPPVSFLGVALSGPSAGSELLTPGRLLVLRYLSGSGPRVIRLDTGRTPTLSYSERVHVRPGGVYYGLPTTPSRGSRIAPSEQVRMSFCGGSKAIFLPSSVRPARSRLVRAAGGALWSTQLLRGPFGLRCLAVARVPNSRGGRRECERIASPGAAVAGVWRSGRAPGTLIAAQAPRLRSMTIVSPLGVRTVRARPGTRVAVAAYDRSVKRTDVRLRLRFAGGRERSFAPYAGSF